jgi:hypothetical protein
MNLEETLLEEIRSLTPEQQQEVLDFASFLKSRSPSPLQRIPGLNKGAFSMAEDFDAPLSDQFWLGEE